VGRFQPIHRGHEALIVDALSVCEKLIMFIGSDSQVRTPKNPFLSCERIEMIKLSFKKDIVDRLIFVPIPDFDDDGSWANHIKKSISDLFPTEKSIGLFGYNKDASSYYLGLFPEYVNLLSQNSYYGSLSSTDIRKKFFDQKIIDTVNLHPNVVKYLETFMEKNVS
jgi:bifunctional NMN adenylyltransferase/nudix hydrolase